MALIDAMAGAVAGGSEAVSDIATRHIVNEERRRWLHEKAAVERAEIDRQFQRDQQEWERRFNIESKARGAAAGAKAAREERRSAADRKSREDIARLDRESRERIAQTNAEGKRYIKATRKDYNEFGAVESETPAIFDTRTLKWDNEPGFGGDGPDAGGGARRSPEDAGDSNIPRPQSRAEYDALAPGTEFVAPDGSRRVKPEVKTGADSGAAASEPARESPPPAVATRPARGARTGGLIGDVQAATETPPPATEPVPTREDRPRSPAPTLFETLNMLSSSEMRPGQEGSRPGGDWPTRDSAKNVSKERLYMRDIIYVTQDPARLQGIPAEERDRMEAFVAKVLRQGIGGGHVSGDLERELNEALTALTLNRRERGQKSPARRAAGAPH